MAHTIFPSVNVFVLDGSKVLLGRRANTGWMDGHLCPFGGHVEEGETPLIAMVREIQEELGVTIPQQELEFMCVAARKNPTKEYVAYEFTLNRNGYEFKNAEPDKCSELVWAELHDLPEDIIDQFRIIIDQGLIQGKKYLEVGY